MADQRVKRFEVAKVWIDGGLAPQPIRRGVVIVTQAIAGGPVGWVVELEHESVVDTPKRNDVGVHILTPEGRSLGGRAIIVEEQIRAGGNHYRLQGTGELSGFALAVDFD